MAGRLIRPLLLWLAALGCAGAAGAAAGSGPPALAFVGVDRGVPRIALAAGGAVRFLSPAGVPAHSPGWSPDGRRMVFAAQTGGRWHITVADPATGRTRRLTRGDADHILPVWSPDGARIAFVRRRGADEQVHVMAADGSAARSLTAPPGRSTVPTWSPDGRWIAFVSTRQGGVPHLFVMRSDGGGVRRLSRPETFVARADGRSGVTMETTGVVLRPGMLHPAWSPDGRRIAYVARVGRAEQQVLIVDRDGGEPRRLSTGYAPAWSPDGSRLALVVPRVGDSQLYIVGADGRNPRRLTVSGANMLPAWSPDGAWLAFLRADGRGVGLVVMRPDGTARQRLADAGADLSMGPSVAWRP